MYNLTNINHWTNIVECLIRLSDGAVIPINPDHTAYQAYLKCLAAGNTQDPADE